MKRTIIATMALAVTLCANALQSSETTTEATVYISIDSGELTALPLHIGYLNNTGESICGLECTLDFPEGVSVLREFSTGEVLNSQHMCMKNIYAHSRNDDTNSWLFTCFSRAANVADKQFSGEGRVATLYLDVSALSQGEYNIALSKAVLVWTDGFNVRQIKARAAGYTLYVGADHAGSADVPTSIQGVAENDTKPQMAPARRGIYTLQGVKVEQPRPGGIYIVNGKKTVIR